MNCQRHRQRLAPLETLLDATQDRLHQPYRAQAMPETAQLVATAAGGGRARRGLRGRAVRTCLPDRAAVAGIPAASQDVLDSTVRDMGIGWDISVTLTGEALASNP